MPFHLRFMGCAAEGRCRLGAMILPAKTVRALPFFSDTLGLSAPACAPCRIAISGYGESVWGA